MHTIADLISALSQPDRFMLRVAGGEFFLETLVAPAAAATPSAPPAVLSGGLAPAACGCARPHDIRH